MEVKRKECIEKKHLWNNSHITKHFVFIYLLTDKRKETEMKERKKKKNSCIHVAFFLFTHGTLFERIG
jgi:hypothetical protein